jgi:hypothetical protein
MVRKPKNIVICCDGTGNQFGNEISNVVKLYSTLIQDREQIAYYRPGVGTMGAPTARGPIEKKASMLAGLAFGSGLLGDIGDAYRYLMDHYNEGDRIFLFGFSRGAYTARALAGVVHSFGLLCSGNEQMIPYILRMYAKHTRRENGQNPNPMPAGDAEQKRFRWTYSRSHEVKLHFVGVWDTVSSMGWTYNPLVLPFAGHNPSIEIGRHALSLDERRCFFKPKIWAEHGKDQDIKQVWFRGVHSDIGGSYPEHESGLSKVALEWMLIEAREAGLRIHPEKVKYVLRDRTPERDMLDYVKPNPADIVHRSLCGVWWLVEFWPHKDEERQSRPLSFPLGRMRRLPADALVHESVKVAPPRLGVRLNKLPQSHRLEKAACFFNDPQHCDYIGKLDGNGVSPADAHTTRFEIGRAAAVSSLILLGAAAVAFARAPARLRI